MTSSDTVRVEELQGLYGPFSFPEKLLQKIWFRREFDGDQARTLDGEQVTVLHPGRWNLLGGPDFRAARLAIGPKPAQVGDVELHLRAEDWDAHGHAADPAYDDVILHVVLFPPEKCHATRGSRGVIPTLPLLPILLHDLEEYAADDSVEVLAGRPAARITEQLGKLAVPELGALLREHAQVRWRQKVHFARLRISRLGWSEACHQTALEILGYRFNRAPMVRVATRVPLGEWSRGAVCLQAVYDTERTVWNLNGIRPANHPRVRLRQYAEWTARVPDWPDRLRALSEQLPAVAAEQPTRSVRRQHRFTTLRAAWTSTLCGSALEGPRFDTLLCDGFLPLLGAVGNSRGEQVWRHWPPGDLPTGLRLALRQLGLGGAGDYPACHAITQGLFGWLLAQEHRDPQSPGRGA